MGWVIEACAGEPPFLVIGEGTLKHRLPLTDGWLFEYGHRGITFLPKSEEEYRVRRHGQHKVRIIYADLERVCEYDLRLIQVTEFKTEGRTMSIRSMRPLQPGEAGN